MKLRPINIGAIASYLIEELPLANGGYWGLRFSPLNGRLWGAKQTPILLLISPVELGD